MLKLAHYPKMYDPRLAAKMAYMNKIWKGRSGFIEVRDLNTEWRVYFRKNAGSHSNTKLLISTDEIELMYAREDFV